MTRKEMIEIKQRENFESVDDMIRTYCPFAYGYTFSEECNVYLNDWTLEQCEKCWKDAVKEK